jgi:hypothetical protein
MDCGETDLDVVTWNEVAQVSIGKQTYEGESE